MEVLGSVFVFGGIATAYIAADQTHAQMDPAVSHFYALIALAVVGFAEFDLIGMSTFLCHEVFSLINHSLGNGGSAKLP